MLTLYESVGRVLARGRGLSTADSAQDLDVFFRFFKPRDRTVAPINTLLGTARSIRAFERLTDVQLTAEAVSEQVFLNAQCSAVPV